MRFIKLQDKKVVAIRYGFSIVDGEIQSESGELGQILQDDGTFENSIIELPIKVPTLELQIEELKQQNLILMDAIATLFESITGGI